MADKDLKVNESGNADVAGELGKVGNRSYSRAGNAQIANM